MGGTPIGQSNRSSTLRGFPLAALLIATFSLPAAGDLGDPGSEFSGWRGAVCCWKLVSLSTAVCLGLAVNGAG